MLRNGKERENLDFSSVAATLEKAITYVFAERLIRNAEVRGSIPLCSSKLSTIDSTLLFAGMLTAAAYFDRSSADEDEILTHTDTTIHFMTELMSSYDPPISLNDLRKSFYDRTHTPPRTFECACFLLLNECSFSIIRPL